MEIDIEILILDGTLPDMYYLIICLIKGRQGKQANCCREMILLVITGCGVLDMYLVSLPYISVL